MIETRMINNVMQYLDNTAANFPDKTAFSDGESGITFADLRGTSRRIASRLINDGLFREPVAVFMDKSPETIAANFAVVYSGNYYAVIDREMPKFRVEMILENLNPRVIICDESTRSLIPQNFANVKTYLYDEIADSESETDEIALEKVRERAIDLDPVYIVFTSGSTGVPKGVTANHRAVIDYIENLSEVLRVSDTTVFGNQAPLYVDACLKELYTTIRSGSTAYLIPKERFMFPIKLVEFLNEFKVNTICWVSSALSLVAGLKTFDKLIPEHLHTVAFGSELFPVKNLNLWKSALPNARFINLYGPTEATGMSCYYEVNRDFAENEKIPIGRAFRNTEIVLLDENDRPSQSGEICIRGTCLSLGYYNDFPRTADSFTQNPAITAYRDLIYRTGDLGCYNDFGELVFVSRKDFQIKHMGYRIELPEIEIAVCRNENIPLACCLYDGEKGKIILFCTGSLSQAEIVGYLKGELPRYMLPSKVITLNEMPLTPNGKIDRNQLKERM